MSRFLLCLTVSLGLAVAFMASVTPTVSAQFFLPRPVTPTEMATGMTPQQIESLPILERPDRPGHIYGNTVRRIYRAQMQQQKMQQQMVQQQQAQKQAAEEKQATEPEQTAEQKPAEQKQTHSVLQQAPQEETPKQTAAQPQVQTQTAAQQAQQPAAQQQATQQRPAQQRRVQRVAPPPFVPFVLQPAGAM